MYSGHEPIFRLQFWCAPSIPLSQPSTAALAVSLLVVPATSALVLLVSVPVVPMPPLPAKVVRASASSTHILYGPAKTDANQPVKHRHCRGWYLETFVKEPLILRGCFCWDPPTPSGSFQILLVVAVVVLYYVCAIECIQRCSAPHHRIVLRTLPFNLAAASSSRSESGMIYSFCPVQHTSAALLLNCFYLCCLLLYRWPQHRTIYAPQPTVTSKGAPLPPVCSVPELPQLNRGPSLRAFPQCKPDSLRRYGAGNLLT